MKPLRFPSTQVKSGASKASLCSLLPSRPSNLCRFPRTVQASNQDAGCSTTCTCTRPAWHSAVASLATAVLLVQQPCAAEELSIAFPASTNPEIGEAQKTLVESWAYVDTLYVDSPDHTKWAKALQEALGASFKAQEAAEVTQINRDLLAKLDDPYTRLLREEEDAALAAEEEGKIVATGLGLQQLSLPVAKDSRAPAGQDLQQQQQLLVVSFVVEGSPAAQAGVQQGDAVLSVAGQSVEGRELRDVYKLLAKESDITLARQPLLPGGIISSSGSGDGSGSAEGSSAGSNAWDAADGAASGVFSAAATTPGTADGVLQGVDVYTVHLKPEPLEFEPALYGIIDLSKQRSTLDSPTAAETPAVPVSTSTGSGSSTGTTGSDSSRTGKVGYLKVLTFSSTAPKAVADALVDMQREAQQQPGGQPLAGLIVDLRDNPGGIVEAGVDIAQDFLHAGQGLCIAVDKTGQEERVVLPEAHTLTELPLAVLVNHSSASTSELLAGALHDELNAPLIGTPTYGKGRTQRVIRLADGKSTLLVSTLKYFTPQHTIIDTVGLQPDVVCKPDEVLGQQWVGGSVGQDGGSLLDDPCIKLAAARFVGTGAL